MDTTVKERAERPPSVTAAEVARELGTSVPRVVRCAQRHGYDSRQGRGRLTLTPTQARELRAALGRRKAAPGLSDTETAALAALARSPLGLTSARAVARKAALSPTAASHALSRLAEAGLVTHEDTVIVAGRSRHVRLLHANRRHPDYLTLAPILAEVGPPETSRDKVVPPGLRHLFWNTDPNQLNVAHDGEYIARRLLRTLDPAGLAWGARNLNPDDWRAAARARGLPADVKALAENLASGSESWIGRGEQKAGPGGPQAGSRDAKFPKEVRDALPAPVLKAWQLIAPHLPPGLYLAGGTAAALRLHHRRSNDLDFFFHDNAVDLDALEAELAKLGAAIDLRGPGTLKVYFGKTKVEFFHADHVRPQHQLAKPSTIGNVQVADIRDLMAMKLKVLAERGELRDYYDVKEMEERQGVSIEDGIALFRDRYGLDNASGAMRQLIMALGYLDDCEEDKSLPMTKAELADWWRKRHRKLIRNLAQ